MTLATPSLLCCICAYGGGIEHRKERSESSTLLCTLQQGMARKPDIPCNLVTSPPAPLKPVATADTFNKGNIRDVAGQVRMLNLRYVWVCELAPREDCETSWAGCCLAVGASKRRSAAALEGRNASP